MKNCLPLQPVLSASKSPTYKIAIFLVPILKALNFVFHFAEEILDQQYDFFMGSLDVDSRFANIPLEKTIEICTTNLCLRSLCPWILKTHMFLIWSTVKCFISFNKLP